MFPLQVLVLPRVTRQVPAYLRPSVSGLDSHTSCSNVYSVPERVLLAWLNYHYTHQRPAVLRCDGTYMYVYLCTCMYIYMYIVHTYVCMYIYMYNVHTYVCMHVHLGVDHVMVIMYRQVMLVYFFLLMRTIL